MRSFGSTLPERRRPMAECRQLFSVTRSTPCSIEHAMRKLALTLTVAVLVVVAVTMRADTPGIFRGVVIHGPEITPGWMFLKSANGQVRKVGISRAEVVYSAAVPAKDRQKAPAMSIASGTEVRVTARQDEDGEWRATRIEILHLHVDLPIAPSKRSTEALHNT
jgi:hypothetical protein